MTSEHVDLGVEHFQQASMAGGHEVEDVPRASATREPPDAPLVRGSGQIVVDEAMGELELCLAAGSVEIRCGTDPEGADGRLLSTRAGHRGKRARATGGARTPARSSCVAR
jgi:hypothetical protein